MPELKYRANFGVDIYSSSSRYVPSRPLSPFPIRREIRVGARSNGEDCQDVQLAV